MVVSSCTGLNRRSEWISATATLKRMVDRNRRGGENSSPKDGYQQAIITNRYDPAENDGCDDTEWENSKKHSSRSKRSRRASTLSDAETATKEKRLRVVKQPAPEEAPPPAPPEAEESPAAALQTTSGYVEKLEILKKSGVCSEGDLNDPLLLSQLAEMPEADAKLALSKYYQKALSVQYVGGTLPPLLRFLEQPEDTHFGRIQTGVVPKGSTAPKSPTMTGKVRIGSLVAASHRIQKSQEYRDVGDAQAGAWDTVPSETIPSTASDVTMAKKAKEKANKKARKEKEKAAAKEQKEKEKQQKISPPPKPEPSPEEALKRIGWAQTTTEDGKAYYYNLETKQTSWTPPEMDQEMW